MSKVITIINPHDTAEMVEIIPTEYPGRSESDPRRHGFIIKGYIAGVLARRSEEIYIHHALDRAADIFRSMGEVQTADHYDDLIA